MNRSERIPTLHELKLAGRVERARALFGPGGYLCVSEAMTEPAETHGPASAPAPPRHSGGGDGERSREGSRQSGSGGEDTAERGKRQKEDNERHTLQPASSPEHGRRNPTKMNQGSPRPMALEETRIGVVAEEDLGRAGRFRAKRGAVTTVTLVIVGGRPGGRGFTNLEQSGKVRYLVNTVARGCVPQRRGLGRASRPRDGRAVP